MKFNKVGYFLLFIFILVIFVIRINKVYNKYYNPDENKYQNKKAKLLYYVKNKIDDKIDTNTNNHK